ncbi:LOW QUALITY PROTEIN: hypothetical protein AAY473_014177 [Plecturocebus cupreus]
MISVEKNQLTPQGSFENTEAHAKGLWSLGKQWSLSYTLRDEQVWWITDWRMEHKGRSRALDADKGRPLRVAGLGNGSSQGETRFLSREDPAGSSAGATGAQHAGAERLPLGLLHGGGLGVSVFSDAAPLQSAAGTPPGGRKQKPTHAIGLCPLGDPARPRQVPKCPFSGSSGNQLRSRRRGPQATPIPCAAWTGSCYPCGDRAGGFGDRCRVRPLVPRGKRRGFGGPQSSPARLLSLVGKLRPPGQGSSRPGS